MRWAVNRALSLAILSFCLKFYEQELSCISFVRHNKLIKILSNTISDPLLKKKIGFLPFLLPSPPFFLVADITHSRTENHSKDKTPEACTSLWWSGDFLFLSLPLVKMTRKNPDPQSQRCKARADGGLFTGQVCDHSTQCLSLSQGLTLNCVFSQ